MEAREFLGLELYRRSVKPRTAGITSVQDRGQPVEEIRGWLEGLGDYIDTVKLNPSRLFSSVEYVRKLTSLFHEYDIPVQPSGIYLEVARVQGKGEETLHKLRDLGFTKVEVSASTGSGIDVEEQVRFATLARSVGFDVVGEVGMKWPEGDLTRRADGGIDVDRTVLEMKAYMDAGVSHFYWEGHLLKRLIGLTEPEALVNRENAIAQIGAVADQVGQDHIIFETSGQLAGGARRLMMLWYVTHFGPDVNIGNVRYEDVPTLESIRRGTHPAIGLGKTGDHPWLRALEASPDGNVGEWWTFENSNRIGAHN
jgi:phosphosulfolactate synthase